MPSKKNTKETLVTNGFSEKFLQEVTEVITSTVKGSDVTRLEPLLEKFEASEMYRFPQMTKLLDDYVGELTGVDVGALREVALKK